MQTPVGALGINLNASSLFSSLYYILDGFLSADCLTFPPHIQHSKHTRTKTNMIYTYFFKQFNLKESFAPFSSHEAHIAFGFPSLLRLEPAKQKHEMSFRLYFSYSGLQSVINMERANRDVPPGYLLLPLLCCPQSILFLFALHKIPAISSLCDLHGHLCRDGEKRIEFDCGTKKKKKERNCWTNGRRCDVV